MRKFKRGDLAVLRDGTAWPVVDIETHLVHGHPEHVYYGLAISLDHAAKMERRVQLSSFGVHRGGDGVSLLYWVRSDKITPAPAANDGEQTTTDRAFLASDDPNVVCDCCWRNDCECLQNDNDA